MTAEVNITIRNNEDWRDAFVLMDLSGQSPAPLDLAGVSLSMHVRSSPTDSAAQFIASTTNGKLRVIPGALVDVTGLAGGTGYTSAPTITFSGGGSDPGKVLPTAYARVAGGAVAEVKIIDRGANLTAAPTIAFAGGGGTGAAATAVIGKACTFDVDWAELTHLSGTYYQDLLAEIGDLRRVLWAGSFTVEDGVTR